MQMYFGAYGVTMTLSAEYFWGPNSPVGLPYVATEMDSVGHFFTRVVGILFLILTVGRTHLGVSEKIWTKQTLLWNVGMTYIFYQNSIEGENFTGWVWQMQTGLSVALSLWGKSMVDKQK